MDPGPPHAVYGHSLVAITDTKFMCIGGSLGYWKHLWDVVTYDVEANAWTIEEDLPYPQRYMICVKTVIRNKEVVLCLFGQFEMQVYCIIACFFLGGGASLD